MRKQMLIPADAAAEEKSDSGNDVEKANSRFKAHREQQSS